MTAAILSIGTELTRGELNNTNATWLAERLTALGFAVVEHSTVDDDEGRIVAAMGRLSGATQVVLVTGGLGPTTDDLTSHAAAIAAGVKLVRDEGSLEEIRKKFRLFNRTMSPSNEKQADFPEGATVLSNAVGTAPGFSLRLGSSLFFFMPGVPTEMRHIFDTHIVGAIASLAPRTTHQIHLRTFGLPESQVGERLSSVETDFPGVTLAYRAHFPEIEVKVLARSANEAEAEIVAKRAAESVRQKLAGYVYGERNDTYPGYLGTLLRERSLTLAVAESCTGGLLGSMITSVSGASDYFVLDAVTYANASKTSLLGVNSETVRAYGAVSPETAAAMAEGALRVSGADLALSITGTAGPTGGTADKPVGTVYFGLARRGEPTVIRTRKLFGDRDRIRTLAAYAGMRLIARAVTQEGGED